MNYAVLKNKTPLGATTSLTQKNRYRKPNNAIGWRFMHTAIIDVILIVSYNNYT
jgi:hypothetical protein